MTEKKSYRILIVDDIQEIRRSLSIFLQDKGYKITTTESGNSALKLLKENQFDLIISDIDMLDGNGFDLLKGIKHFKYSTPLIFITGNSRIAEKDVLDLGAVALIDKMKIHLKLLSLVESTLSKRFQGTKN